MTPERAAPAGDVRIHPTRIDLSGCKPLTAFARFGADAFGYTAVLRLDRQLAQLLRLRVAQINNCTYCLDLHQRAARNVGIPQVTLDCLTAWWETDLFSAAEQAALGYAEALTRVADTTATRRFQPAHDTLRAHFDDDVIAEIVGVVVNMNVWTRLKLAEGAMPAWGHEEAAGAPGPVPG